jgi:hypothetical protein
MTLLRSSIIFFIVKWLLTLVTSLGHYKSAGSLPNMGLACPVIVRYDNFMVNSPVNNVTVVYRDAQGTLLKGWISGL